MNDSTPSAFSLDDLDHRILVSLRADPRQTNKALATELAVTEATIALRIRALEKAGVMKIMAQRDFRSAGYQVLAQVALGIGRRPIADVVEDLNGIEAVAGVSIVMGDPPLMMMVMAASLSELEHVVHEQIAKVDGVTAVSTAIYCDILKHESEYAEL